jgi:ubiquinone biosynthesis protein COQ4
MLSLEKLRLVNMDYLNALKGFVSLIKSPENTESVYDVEDGLKNIKASQLAVTYAKQQPGVADLFTERYLAPHPDLGALLELPADSLGYAYATYLTERGFDPNFYRAIAIEDDATYLFMRMRQTHDLWHVVGGFSTDVEGELALKAFELSQTRRTMSLILLLGGILRTVFREPECLDDLLNAIAHGYRLGRQAKPFLAQKWELQWEKPLQQWQRELNVGLL